MNKILSLFLIMLVTACSNSPQGIAPVNVMLMIQDDSADALPYTHQSTHRLVNAVANDLTTAGVNVYDDKIGSLDDFGDTSRSKAALIDMARSYPGAKIDYVVVLSAEAAVNSTNYTTKISSRVLGQIIATYSGRVVGSVSASGDRVNKGDGCERTCINNGIGDSLSSAAGEVAAQILSALPVSGTQGNTVRRTPAPMVMDYTLQFDGFSQDEMNAIEDYLRLFSGYEEMRYTRSSHRYTEIWYQSAISESKLLRNLKRMLNELDTSATVNYAGNIATVKKISQRGKSTKFDLDGWE